MNLDKQTQAWLAAEREAFRAEQELEALGQAAADPRMVTMFAKSRELRARAEALFKDLRKAIRDAES